MVILVATIVGLVLWIVLWAIGIKAFDALMLTTLIIVMACAWHVIAPYLPGNRDDAVPKRTGI